MHEKLYLTPTQDVNNLLYNSLFAPVGSHCSGMLPHRQATRPGNMLTVNQEIPEELVQTEEAVFCPLLAGQMSVSSFFC